MQSLRSPYGLRVDFAAADDRDLLGAGSAGRNRGRADRSVNIVRDLNALRSVTHIAGDDDRQPARQGAADGLKGLAAHNERLAHRQRLEALEVARQPPGQALTGTNDAVTGHGGDERDDGLAQTATGALIAGQGS